MQRLKRSREQLGRGVDVHDFATHSTEGSSGRLDKGRLCLSPIMSPKQLSVDAKYFQEGGMDREEPELSALYPPSSAETPLESSSQHFFDDSLGAVDGPGHSSLVESHALSEQFLSQTCWGASEGE